MLILSYKSVAINIDEHYTKHLEGNIAARKTFSISFAHPTAIKNCYRHSFMPWTLAEWNLLPATMTEGHMLTPLNLDCAVLSFLLILPETKLHSNIRRQPHTYSYNSLSRMCKSDCSTRQKQKLCLCSLV